MKVVVLNFKTNQVEVLGYDGQECDVEDFLCEKGYSLGNIQFMVCDTPDVSVVNIDNGQHGYIGTLTIDDQCKRIQRREQEELEGKFNELVGEGDGEYTFEGDGVWVASYFFDKPDDVAITKVVREDGHLHLVGGDVEGYNRDIEIELEDVFAGHLEFVTSAMK